MKKMVATVVSAVMLMASAQASNVVRFNNQLDEPIVLQCQNWDAEQSIQPGGYQDIAAESLPSNQPSVCFIHKDGVSRKLSFRLQKKRSSLV